MKLQTIIPIIMPSGGYGQLSESDLKMLLGTGVFILSIWAILLIITVIAFFALAVYVMLVESKPVKVSC